MQPLRPTDQSSQITWNLTYCTSTEGRFYPTRIETWSYEYNESKNTRTGGALEQIRYTTNRATDWAADTKVLRLTAPFFSKRSVNLAAPIFRKNVELLCTLFQTHKQNGESFDVHVDYLAFSTESLLNSGFGNSMGLLESYEQAKDWRESIDAVQKATALIKQIYWMGPSILRLPPGLVKMFSPTLARLFQIRKASLTQC
jgi:hypothetical protein